MRIVSRHFEQEISIRVGERVEALLVVIPLCDKYQGTSSEIQGELDMMRLELTQKVVTTAKNPRLKKIVEKSVPAVQSTSNVVDKV